MMFLILSEQCFIHQRALVKLPYTFIKFHFFRSQHCHSCYAKILVHFHVGYFRVSLPFALKRVLLQVSRHGICCLLIFRHFCTLIEKQAKARSLSRILSFFLLVRCKLHALQVTCPGLSTMHELNPVDVVAHLPARHRA